MTDGPATQPIDGTWTRRTQAVVGALAATGPVLGFVAGLMAGDPKDVVREVVAGVQGPFGALTLSVIVCSALVWFILRKERELERRELVCVERLRVKDATIERRDVEVSRINEERVKDAKFMADQMARLASVMDKRVDEEGHR